ncbi:hypothetical protein U1Q18_041415 [Sarracenia purpurea var. burkii]
MLKLLRLIIRLVKLGTKIIHATLLGKMEQLSQHRAKLNRWTVCEKCINIREISTVLIFIDVGIGVKLFLIPSCQWLLMFSLPLVTTKFLGIRKEGERSERSFDKKNKFTMCDLFGYLYYW